MDIRFVHSTNFNFTMHPHLFSIIHQLTIQPLTLLIKWLQVWSEMALVSHCSSSPAMLSSVQSLNLVCKVKIWIRHLNYLHTVRLYKQAKSILAAASRTNQKVQHKKVKLPKIQLHTYLWMSVCQSLEKGGPMFRN